MTQPWLHHRFTWGVCKKLQSRNLIICQLNQNLEDVIQASIFFLCQRSPTYCLARTRDTLYRVSCILPRCLWELLNFLKRWKVSEVRPVTCFSFISKYTWLFTQEHLCMGVWHKACLPGASSLLRVVTDCET